MAHNVDRLEWIIRRHIVKSIPDFADLDLKDLLIEYRSWRARFIAPQKRAVHISAELESTMTLGQRTALDDVVGSIERGADLTPRLSRAIRLPKRNGRPDRLLSAWGVHHLHLGVQLDSDGIVERGDEVLFAMFTDTDAYLIGIYAHQPRDNWAAEDILRIVVNNWPDEGLVLESRYAIGLSQTFDDEDRLQLRNAGINALLEIDGRVYSPGSIGMTVAGGPMTATMEANGLAWALDDWRSNYDRNLRSAQAEKPGAFWWPMIQVTRPGFEEYCGFASGKAAFATVGRLC